MAKSMQALYRAVEDTDEERARRIAKEKEVNARRSALQKELRELNAEQLVRFSDGST